MPSETKLDDRNKHRHRNKLSKRREQRKKESRILSILHWRRMCRRLLELHYELNQTKNNLAKAALDLCDNAIKTFEHNNTRRLIFEKTKRKDERNRAMGVADTKVSTTEAPGAVIPAVIT